MCALFRKSKSGDDPGAPFAFTTARGDWDEMINELFSVVVANIPFAVGVIFPERGMVKTTLNMRLNQNYPLRAAIKFTRDHFRAQAFEKIFISDEGMEIGPMTGLSKVSAENIGLPKHTLILRIRHETEEKQRALLLFGGERLEGQLEKRVRFVELILEGAGKVKIPKVNTENLMGQLEALNVNKMGERDIDELSNIVNGLEEDFKTMSKDNQVKYKALSDYVMNKRVRR